MRLGERMPHNFLDRKKKPLSSSGGGYKPLHEEESLRKPQAREETVRERAARQRRERQAELTYTQEDYARWERNRKRRQLEVEAQKAIEELLIFLPALDLETSVHSQAVKEFSEAFDVILKGYNGGNISYETGYDLIHQVKNGFIEGGGALRKVEENRLSRQTEKADNFSQDGSYRRNLVVNDESFNVRFKASCATPECLMRNANIDMEDDAFQDYIEAATQDKRSDVMQVIGVALIANPYLKPLEYVVFGDIAYAGLKDKNLDPLWAYLMGRGAYYRLHLLSVSKRVKDTSENVVSYFSGSVLSSD
ncbi:hypothetical protein P7M06_23470 [Vibrio parahaemolyticus]|nr:hypothetical protein [Vibrio parahaemolyticus]